MSKVREIALSILKESIVTDVDFFDGEVPVLSDAKLGFEAKKFRISMGAKAVDVAKMLKLTKVKICFLEQGVKRWDMDILEKYVKAVLVSSKNRSSLPKHARGSNEKAA